MRLIHPRRLLSQEEADRMSRDELIMARRHGFVPPLAGADGSDDDDNEDGDDKSAAGGGRTVPLSELQRERRKRVEAENKLAEKNREAEEAARAELSELERVKAKLAEVEAERDTLKADGVKRDKSDLVRKAATAANFHDADDATARIALADIETEDDAKRAVADLAKASPHLVKAEEKGGSGGDLEKVLANGRQTEEKADEAKAPPLSHDDLNAMSQEALADLMRTDPDRFQRSVNAGAAPA